MKQGILYTLISSLIILTSCNVSGGTYINISVKDSTSDTFQLDAEINDFTFDDKPYNIMRAGRTFDEGSFYELSSFGNYRLDLKSGKVSGMCQKPGCSHSENSAGCLDRFSFLSPVGSDKGLYYLSGSCVMLYSGGSSEVVYENKYCTDYEKEYMPDNMYDLGALCFQNGRLYVIGATFFYELETETGNTTQPVKISDSPIWSLCADEHYVYVTNENEELLCYDMQSGSIKKLSDKTAQCCIYDGCLYFIRYDMGVPALCRLQDPAAQPEQIIDDCYVNYCINSGFVYYQNYSSGRDMYVCRLDGSDKKRITLDCKVNDENGEPREYDQQKLYNISTSSHINYVFVSDTDDGVIFAFKAGNEDYQAIPLGGDV